MFAGANQLRTSSGAVAAARAEHLSGADRRLLLRLDHLALPELDSVVLHRELSLEIDGFGVVYRWRSPRRHAGRHAGRRLVGQNPSTHGRSIDSPAISHRGRFLRCLPVHDPGCPATRPDRLCRVPFARIVLYGAYRGPDLVGSDGHCAPLRWNGQRHDELRLRGRRLVSPFSFGYIVDLTGSWITPFIGSIVLLLAGAILAARLRPDRRFYGG